MLEPHERDQVEAAERDLLDCLGLVEIDGVGFDGDWLRSVSGMDLVIKLAAVAAEVGQDGRLAAVLALPLRRDELGIRLAVVGRADPAGGDAG